MIKEGRTGWHLESHTDLRQTQGRCITFNNMSLSSERNREIAVWAAFGRAKRETKPDSVCWFKWTFKVFRGERRPAEEIAHGNT